MNKVSLFILVLFFSCKNELIVLKSTELKASSQNVDLFDTYPLKVKKLRESIANGKLPNFILDECFICKCRISIYDSERRIDCFTSMLDSLNYSEITFLANWHDSFSLKTRCSDSSICGYKADMARSRWGAIQYVYKKKTLILTLSDYYSKPLVSNQSGIDTNGVYSRTFKTVHNSKIHQVYRFNSNGTYYMYYLVDKEENPQIDASRIAEKGRYYRDTYGQKLTLEHVYPNSDYSGVVRVILTFKVKKSGISLQTRQSSVSNDIIKVYSTDFRRYNEIKFKQK